MPWTTSPDENFVKSYIEFIGMLVTARAEWRGIAVASVARRLTHREFLISVIVNAPNAFARFIPQYLHPISTFLFVNTTGHITHDLCTNTSSLAELTLPGSHSTPNTAGPFPSLLSSQKSQRYEP